ncbi:unnamed protein product [Trifolium pratense]|uniref:Uncharacterized protein n=1 Tax=Trifolium pratense TaxID=57577 RepID=A0ACB0MFI1_TRIPR|nr:unnamed protein product [Trifolium pratense]
MKFREDLEIEILLRLPLKSLMSLLPCDAYNHKPILVNSLFPNHNHLERIESYGSCDGVFCLKGVYRDTANYGHGQLIMWNPTTNEVHHIPRAPSRNTNDFSYGFGAVGGDFKVIRLTSYVKRMARLLCHSAEVYSLNSKVNILNPGQLSTLVALILMSNNTAVIQAILMHINILLQDIMLLLMVFIIGLQAQI